MNQIHEVLWCSLHTVSNRKVEVVADTVATYQHCRTYEFDSSISQLRLWEPTNQICGFVLSCKGGRWHISVSRERVGGDAFF